jgi:5-methyltetrahydrofolate--homocysteine methyltransferase
VLWLHGEFLSAGSDLILTNSFGGNALRLKLHKAESRVRELNIAAANLARQAVEAHAKKPVQRRWWQGLLAPLGSYLNPWVP